MENTKMDTYEKDFEKECRDYVKNIALELEDYADHEMIKCPQCEAVFNPDHVYHAEDDENDEGDEMEFEDELPEDEDIDETEDEGE